MRTLFRAITAHFTTDRCLYCGTRQDRDEGRGCETSTMWSAQHIFPDGTGRMLTGAAPGPYDDDEDD